MTNRTIVARKFQNKKCQTTILSIFYHRIIGVKRSCWSHAITPQSAPVAENSANECSTRSVTNINEKGAPKCFANRKKTNASPGIF